MKISFNSKEHLLRETILGNYDKLKHWFNLLLEQD